MTSTRRRINWEQVKQRLEESQHALEAGATVTAETLREVYSTRARQLAARKDRHSNRLATLQVFAFEVAGVCYGIELAQVKRVFPLRACTPVPGAPAYVMGVVNLEGEVFSLLDLGQFWGRARNATSAAHGYVLLVRTERDFAALWAECLEGVREVAIDDLQPIDADEADQRRSAIRGFTPDRLALLDLQRMLMPL